MLFDRFFQDRRGGVAPLLALAILPMMGILGAAVDYSRASTLRTTMQSAIDATALMLTKEAKTLTNVALGAKATEYFNAFFNRPEAQNIQLTPTFSEPQPGNYILKIDGSMSINTMFASLLGRSQINLFSSSEVYWGVKKLNIALALDNTYSMASSGKMTALKQAAHSLLTTLQAAEKTPGDIKVSIVPFATDVNVGTSNVSASWINWTEWDAANGTCSGNGYTSKSTCESAGKIWTPANHSTWQGCVWDRNPDDDVKNTAASDTSAKYFAHQPRLLSISQCPTTMMPLSTEWTVLHSKIDQMTTPFLAATNVTIGLQVAWQSLSPVAPFNAPPPAPDLDKVLILLTDGDNTNSRGSSSQSVMDVRTQLVCENAKADNIKIYAVRVIDGNADLLRNCATKPDMYYDVDQASQLNAVFNTIAQKLATLRIAK